MSALTCQSSGAGDFTLTIDSVSYQCVTDSPPLVLLAQGGMTLSDFNILWPALIGLMVTGFIVKRLLAAF
jgi:hypothetical protein